MSLPIEIPLAGGHVALIDAEDHEMVAGYKWRAHQNYRVFYAHASIRVPKLGPRTVRMHKLITGWPVTDHINGNGLDNRRCNLRPANPHQNARNRRLISTCNTSGYKGVSWDRNAWVAHIGIAGRRLYLGRFPSIEDAARAYDRAAFEHYGEFARPNFPAEAVQ